MPPTQAQKVTRPLMYHTWSHMTFLHWRYSAGEIQSLLPSGLTADEFDGSAWVGLTPFLMDEVRPPLLPALPWLSRFPETNVRTYVHDVEGRNGRADADVETGDPIARDDLTDFLVERYRLFTVIAGRLATAEVEHRPWPLRRAATIRLEQDLLKRGGLTAPLGDPITHASEGVRVKVGMWRWCPSC